MRSLGPRKRSAGEPMPRAKACWTLKQRWRQLPKELSERNTERAATVRPFLLVHVQPGQGASGATSSAGHAVRQRLLASHWNVLDAAVLATCCGLSRVR